MNLKKQGGYVGDSERIKQEERKDMWYEVLKRHEKVKKCRIMEYKICKN